MDIQDAAFVLLGAGSSTRFGVKHKLNQEVLGRPLFAWTLDAILGTNAGRVLIIWNQAVPILDDHLLASDRLEMVTVNSECMAESMRIGLRQPMLKMAQVVGVLPMDLPLLSSRMILAFWRYIQEQDLVGKGWIARPRVGDVPGHPVFFSGECLEACRQIGNASKPKDVVEKYRHCLHLYESDEQGFIRDVDTADDLRLVAGEIKKRRM